MGLSTVLDVVIGLCFAYFLLALFCSWANEAVAAFLNRRGKYLFDGLRELIQHKGTLKNIVQHPLIESLDKVRQDAWLVTRDRVNANENHWLRRRYFPSYLPTGTFATVLLDVVLKQSGSSANGFNDARNAIDKHTSGKLHDALLAIADRADHDIEALRKGIEEWYSNTMDRVSGWYKSRTQLWLILYGFAFALAFNVDTFKIVHELWNNPVARAAAANAAERTMADPEIRKAMGEIADTNKKPEEREAAHARLAEKLKLDKSGTGAVFMKDAALPVGWGPKAQEEIADCGKSLRAFSFKDCRVPDNVSNFQMLLKFLGLLVTACAVALGAPFWFELVNKLIDIRGAGKKPEEKK